MGATLAARGTNRTQVAAQAIAAIKETGRISAGWEAAGIAERTFWMYRKEDPALEEAVQEALRQGLRRNLERGHSITTTLLDRAEDAPAGAEGRDDRREALDWVSRLGLRMAQAKLPEYRKETTATVSVTLEIGPSLAAAISGPPEVTDPVTEAIDVTPRIEVDES